MEKKLLRENHTRQDKARKPDYRNEYEPRSTYQPGSIVGNLLEKAKAKERFAEQYQNAEFIHKTLRFRLRWRLHEFANANQVLESEPSTRAIYAKFQSMARHDLKSIRAAIKQGEVRTRKSFSLAQGTFTYTTYFDFKRPALMCDEVLLPEG